MKLHCQLSSQQQCRAQIPRRSIDTDLRSRQNFHRVQASSNSNPASSHQKQNWTTQLLLASLNALTVLSLTVAPLPAFASDQFQETQRNVEEEYFQTVPQGLTSSDDDKPEPNLGRLLEGAGVQQCTRKCVPTCIRGGQGAPGLGPMSVRKEIVVFKEGYRTRQYCLSECIQVCALQKQAGK